MKNVVQPGNLQSGQASKNIEVYTQCLLVRLLTDEYSLLVQTLQAFWQRRDPVDLDGQDFLDWQVGKTTELTDGLIHQVNLDGHFRIDDISDYLWMARLPELLDEETNADGHLGALLRGHTTLMDLLEADLATVQAEGGPENTIQFLQHLRDQHRAIADIIRNYPDGGVPGAGQIPAVVLDTGGPEVVVKRAA